jgi:hypothetical protein
MVQVGVAIADGDGEVQQVAVVSVRGRLNRTTLRSRASRPGPMITYGHGMNGAMNSAASTRIERHKARQAGQCRLPEAPPGGVTGGLRVRPRRAVGTGGAASSSGMRGNYLPQGGEARRVGCRQ